MIFKLLIIIIFSLNQKSETINVISYNIRYDNPKDGINNWNNRKSAVSNLLNNQNLDFIGLQEVLDSQLLYLVKDLIEYDFIGVGRKDGKTKGEYSPIFFQKEKYKLLRENTFWLSETPEKISRGWDASLERICTYGLFLNKLTKKKIWIFNTHFDHKGKIARSKSVDLLIDKINTLNFENYPVIITGDFNLTPDKLPIKKMQHKFIDVQKNLLVSDKFYGTWNGFDTEKKSLKRIDYIFIEGLNISIAKHIYFKTPIGGWASDHHPVFASLKR